MSLWGSTYSRLPNGFFDRAEVLEAGEKAAFFLLRMSDFSDRNETDGELSDHQTASLGSPKSVRAATERLQSVDLLERKEDDKGWRIVGWLDGHKTSDDRSKLRETRRKSGAKGGRAKAKTGPKLEANGKQVAKQVASPLLNPDTDTYTDTEPPSSSPPTTTPVDNRGEDGDGVVVAAREVIAALGDQSPDPTDLEVTLVRAAIDEGSSVEHLVDLAQLARTTAEKPRRYLAKCLTNAADSPPPADHSVCCGGELIIFPPNGGDPYQCPGF